MKLAVSNIAWTNEEETEAAGLLRSLGVKYLEIAPTKKWQDPTRTTTQELSEYRAFWQSYGIEIVAFQSMLFTRPDLKLFDSVQNRTATLAYLKDFIAIAHHMGAGVMVFGSPKNRQRGTMSLNDANSIAADFFTELAGSAAADNVRFCIEPNAAQYACDFVTNAAEGIAFVERVNQPGFGLHLDIACMTLAGDNITESITAAAHLLEHFHISSPMLESVEARDDVGHAEAATALRAIGYDKFVSIEMKPDATGNLERLERAVVFAQQQYGV